MFYLVTSCYRELCDFTLILTCVAAPPMRLVLSEPHSTFFFFSQEKKETKGERPLVSYREQRFLTFASVELDGNVYMTPQDFLESVTEEHPRRKFILSES